MKRADILCRLAGIGIIQHIFFNRKVAGRCPVFHKQGGAVTEMSSDRQRNNACKNGDSDPERPERLCFLFRRGPLLSGTLFRSFIRFKRIDALCFLLCLYCHTAIVKQSCAKLNLMNEKLLLENGPDLAVVIGAQSTEGLTGCGLSILACPVEESRWNIDLSPWPAKAVFRGTPDFEGGADTFFSRLLPEIQAAKETHPGRLFLCGYSLAGLFSLYVCTQYDLFDGCASVSGSLWYPGWTDWQKEHPLQCRDVYFSLGDKEPKTKHPLMKTVGEKTAESCNLAGLTSAAVFEWNEGGHFCDESVRIAKALAWLMRSGEADRTEAMAYSG